MIGAGIRERVRARVGSSVRTSGGKCVGGLREPMWKASAVVCACVRVVWSMALREEGTETRGARRSAERAVLGRSGR